MKNKLIKFSWLPASWGLRGTTREIAEAEYYLTGEPLDHRLADITIPSEVQRQLRHLELDLFYERITSYEHDTQSAKIRLIDDELARELLIIEHRHGKIDDYAFDCQLADMENPTKKTRQLARYAVDLHHENLTAYEHDIKVAELEHEDDAKALTLAKLDIDLAHKKIDQRKFNRDRATANDEPFIAVVKSEYDPREGVNGLFFEFDWNDLMVEYLRLNGYQGLTDEQVVENWFNDICLAVAMETSEEVAPDEPIPFNSQRPARTAGRMINRIPRDGGSSEYS